MGQERAVPPVWLEALQDVIYVIQISPTFGFEFVSDSVTDLIGYTPQEHYDDPELGARILDPRDAQRMAAMTQAPPGKRLEVTLRWRRRDSRVVWTQHRCIKQKRPDGSLVLIGSARDVSEQVRDRESLAAAREQYRLLAENASDVVVRCNNAGRFEWLSESVVDVLGWQPGHLVGRAFVEFVHSEDRQQVRAIEETLLGGRASEIEVRLRQSDGDWQWIAMTVRPVFDADGEVVGSVAGWRDNQANVEARRALASSEAHFRALVQLATIGLVIVDTAGEITSVNNAACTILGRPPEVLRGTNWHVLGSEESRNAIETITSGRADQVRFEAQIRTAAGAQVWVDESVLAVRDAQGALDFVMIQIWDITGRVLAEQALQQSHEQYRLLAENAADIVLRLDHFTAAWVSPSVHRLSGYHPDEVVGRSVLEFVHPQDEARAKRSLQRILFGEARSDTEEIRLRRKDGRYAWWQGTTRSTGTGTAAVLALRNIDSEMASRQAAALEQSRRVAAVESMLDPHVLLEAVTSDDGEVHDFRIVDANDAACNLFSASRSEVVGSLATQLSGCFAPIGMFAQFRDVLETGTPLIVDDAQLAYGNSDYYLDFRTVRVDSDSLSVTWREVSERHRILAELEDSRARYRAIIDSELEPHITLNAVRDDTGTIMDFRYAEANRAALEYLGLTEEEFQDLSVGQMYPSSEASHLRDMYAHTVETGEPLDLDDYAYPTAMDSDATRYYDLRGAKLGDGLSLAWRDVTDRHQTAQRLAESEQRYRLLAENATDVVLRLDADGRFSFCSDGIQRVLGWTPSDVLGKSVGSFVHPEDLKIIERLNQGSGSETLAATRLRMSTASGEFRWTELAGRRIGDGQGLIAGMRDVTTEMKAQQSLERQARTDALTGLLNRGEALATLQQMLDYSTASIALLFLDLDNLKDFNDALGHAAGDRVLAVSSRRLLDSTRSQDLVARIGGDEFLIALPQMPGDDAIDIAETIRAAVSRPINLPTGPIIATVSIGVAASEADDDVDALIARADRAMYAAKQAGRNRVATLAPS